MSLMPEGGCIQGVNVLIVGRWLVLVELNLNLVADMGKMWANSSNVLILRDGSALLDYLCLKFILRNDAQGSNHETFLTLLV